jgi:AraC-like DNA-binding protein
MSAFESVHAEHLTVERHGTTSMSIAGETVLVFNVHGDLVVQTGRGDTILHSNEGFLLRVDGSQIAFHRSLPGELYILKFRQGRARGGSPRRRVEVPDHVTVLRPGRLTNLLRRLVDEERQPVPSRIVLHHLVVLALCELARSSRVGEAAEGREAGLESIASRVDAFIAAHYHESVGTPDIARELHYNPDYLERAYRMERRMSIREAVHARRIKEARAQLLLQRGKGVAEIAALCGYADPGYFRRVFKRATNMTPRGYRLVNAVPLGTPAGLAAGFHA